jgi:hypothetical protein
MPQDSPRLGAYEVLGELGRGGMGCVFRARHGPTGALRALKLLAGGVDAESVLRFKREAEVLARVGGRGIVSVHETGFERGRLWFAMDLVEGGSLRDRTKRGPFAWRDAARLALELARVLERCHAAGVIHRDVKPANVLLDEEGRPWLADFGLVRDLAAASLTETGTLLGTVAYMAPEQLRAEPVTGKADVFALGAVLHELVAGAPLHPGKNLAEQQQERARPRPRLEALGAPRSLDRAIDRALADSAERRSSAAELARDLEAVLAGEAAAKPAPRRRGRIAAAGVLVAIGVALVVAIKGALRPGAPPAPPAPPTAARPEVGLPADLLALVESGKVGLHGPRRDEWKPFAAALYERGVAAVDTRAARRLLLAARGLDAVPAALAVPVARFWCQHLLEDEDLADEERMVVAPDPRMPEIDDAFACFGDAVAASPPGAVALPWPVLGRLLILGELGVVHEGIIHRLTGAWPGNPALVVTESEDSLRKVKPSLAAVTSALALVESAKAEPGLDAELRRTLRVLLLETLVDLAQKIGPPELALEKARELHTTWPCHHTVLLLTLSLVHFKRYEELVAVTDQEPAGTAPVLMDKLGFGLRANSEDDRARGLSQRLIALGALGRTDEARKLGGDLLARRGVAVLVKETAVMDALRLASDYAHQRRDDTFYPRLLDDQLDDDARALAARGIVRGSGVLARPGVPEALARAVTTLAEHERLDDARDIARRVPPVFADFHAKVDPLLGDGAK